MIDFETFERLVRDALSNLYDHTVMETHPLNEYLPKPQNESRGSYLRRMLTETIETLRPDVKEGDAITDELRPYLVLHGRYIEGLGTPELQDRLALGERQLRRLQSRSIHALAVMLWDQVFQEPESDAPEDTNPYAYTTHHEPLNILEVIKGVVDIFQKRPHGDELQFIYAIPPGLPLVKTDRVILRQIFISLISLAANLSECGAIHIGAGLEKSWLCLSIAFKLDEEFTYQRISKHALLETTRYWIEQLHAKLQLSAPGENPDGMARLTLYLPHDRQAVIYVIEDQETSIRLYDRYLRRYHVQVVGIHDPSQVIGMAKKDRPQAILLDIMMPAIDGWEVLQALKAHPEINQIPVLVCSAWGDADLALSLGASAFLKKPISPQHLLDSLQRLNLLDNLGTPSPEST